VVILLLLPWGRRPFTTAHAPWPLAVARSSTAAAATAVVPSSFTAAKAGVGSGGGGGGGALATPAGVPCPKEHEGGGSRHTPEHAHTGGGAVKREHTSTSLQIIGQQTEQLLTGVS
jgi:hypothetical protein